MGDMLTTARRAALAGGAILRSYFGRELEAREKRGDDLVTEADLAAEETILAILRSASPDFGLYSEELGEVRAESEYVWAVDPLDGTNNFVLGLPQFGVSVSLLRSGEPVLGVVYHPVADRLWEAASGVGASCNGVPVSPASQVELRRATVAYVQGYPVGRERGEAVQRPLRDAAKRVLTSWASALDWCLLAEGKVAAVVSMESEQEDLLAGVLIAREAGALLTDFRGEPYLPGMTHMLGAADPGTQGELLRLLAPFAASPE
ncbi:MAG: inositol monophosphatase [Actinomycetota bacterium]|nr:inositol monophosphatase [Actinomycetota bacterium]